MDELDEMEAALAALRRAEMHAGAFAGRARALGERMTGLPPRYGEVLASLLDRLEASALFTEESCSFSQADLLDNLQQWIAKARAVQAV
jgi:hypothetical protein